MRLRPLKGKEQTMSTNRNKTVVALALMAAVLFHATSVWAAARPSQGGTRYAAELNRIEKLHVEVAGYLESHRRFRAGPSWKRMDEAKRQKSLIRLYETITAHIKGVEKGLRYAGPRCKARDILLRYEAELRQARSGRPVRGAVGGGCGI